MRAALHVLRCANRIMLAPSDDSPSIGDRGSPFQNAAVGAARPEHTAALEIDPQDGAAPGRAAQLGEPRVDERAAAAYVQLAPGDLLPRVGDHRIALQ